MARHLDGVLRARGQARYDKIGAHGAGAAEDVAAAAAAAAEDRVAGGLPTAAAEPDLEEEGLGEAAVEARLARHAEAVHGPVRDATVLRGRRRHCKQRESV